MSENAQLDDSAHYRCSASNYLGSASSAARVRVQSDLPASPPLFTSRPRSQVWGVQLLGWSGCALLVKVVEEGGIVELTCVAAGSPYPTLAWWRHNRILAGPGRISVSTGGQHLRIQVRLM